MCSFITFLLVATFGLSLVNSDQALKFYQEKNFHQAKELSNDEMKELANLGDMDHFKKVLNEILIPRVVGTPNHEKVGNYIVKQMSDLGWTVEENSFVDDTPVFGPLTFKNIIAKLNPDAERYLVLACHYDSKYTREHVFVGATDSAVPCAMMINLAKVMSAKLENLKTSNLSLMFIFFDGEEAFRLWGPTDSIYGARHLAQHWHGTEYKDGANYLQRMETALRNVDDASSGLWNVTPPHAYSTVQHNDMLVLLDLLGAPDPVFYSYISATERWYVRLADAEQKLADLDQLRGYSRGKAEQNYFRLRSSNAYIEDDHIPFMRRNVDVLHIIPTPFPPVWHTAADDRSALDYNTIENLNKIMRVFVAEYLHL